jgi:hypothetical protein
LSADSALSVPVLIVMIQYRRAINPPVASDAAMRRQ